MKNKWHITGLKLLLQFWLVLATVVTLSFFIDQSATPYSGSVWEFVKVVLGPFIGAGLAFAANDFIYTQNQEAQEIAKMYGAAFALLAMYDDFVNYRYSVRMEAARLEKWYSKWPEDAAPMWAFAKPLIFPFRTDGFPNLEALEFLLPHSQGRIAFQKLQLLERTYKDLAGAHTLLLTTADAVQLKMDTGPEEINTSWTAASAHVGRKLTTAANDVFLAVILRTQNDEEFYITAANSILEAAEVHFKERLDILLPSISKDKFVKGNLPLLPKVVADALKKLNDDQTASVSIKSESK